MPRLRLVATVTACLCRLAAADGVGDPQLMTDHPFWQGELSCSTFERLARTQAAQYERATGRKADNDEDKAIAAWYWRNTHFFHCTPQPEPDVLGAGKAETTRDFWAGLFAYGHALCGDNHHQFSGELEYLLGHGRTRTVSVAGHTSCEVFLTGGAYGAGKWVLLDSDIATVAFDQAQSKLLSIADLVAADRKALLTNRAAKDNRGWLPELCPGDGVGTYTKISAYMLLSGYAGVAPTVRLRPGETLRRYPRPGLGKGDPAGELVYSGTTIDGMAGPNRHATWVTEPDKAFNATARPKMETTPERRGRFGNAVFTYVPDFAGGGYQAGIAAEDAESVVLAHYSPYVIAAKPAGKSTAEPGATRGLVLNGKAACKVSLSVDGMQTFSEPVDFKDGLDLTDLVKGRYGYWLKLHAPAKDLAGKDLRISTTCMANGYVMPQLKPGGTQVTFNTAPQAVTLFGPQKATLEKNLTAGELGKGSFTIKLRTPRGEKIRRIDFAGRMASGSPPKTEVMYKAEYSKDGTAWLPLKEGWQVKPPVEFTYPDSWSQSFFYGGKEVEGLEGEVLVRLSNSGNRGMLMGQFALTYAVPNTGATRVTYGWSENGQEKTAEHLYPAGAAMDASWKIDTGAAAKMGWVEMKAE